MVKDITTRMSNTVTLKLGVLIYNVVDITTQINNGHKIVQIRLDQSGVTNTKIIKNRFIFSSVTAVAIYGSPRKHRYQTVLEHSCTIQHCQVRWILSTISGELDSY